MSPRKHCLGRRLDLGAAGQTVKTGKGKAPAREDSDKERIDEKTTLHDSVGKYKDLREMMRVHQRLLTDLIKVMMILKRQQLHIEAMPVAHTPSSSSGTQTQREPTLTDFMKL